MNDCEAPLRLCDDPMRVPNEYFVFLQSGYSLEHHKQAVGNGTDLGSAITHVFPETESHGLYYCAELHDASLVAVRADFGVDMVECNLEAFLIELPAPYPDA